jgi:beta-phosphoglucomutase-like phosphatase (HAD superfamily)
MDGTLVDTETYWIAAEYDLIRAHGGTWSDDHAEALVGADLLDAGDYIRVNAGIDRTPVEIVDELLDGVIRRIHQAIPWRPGARELLAACDEAGIPALPPGSFTVTVCGDEVRHGKPHPEPYLAAAAALGVDPADCVALEDSPTGAASAQAAGCVVIGIPNVVGVPPAPHRVLIDSLEQLDLDLLRDLAVRHRPGAAAT